MYSIPTAARTAQNIIHAMLRKLSLCTGLCRSRWTILHELTPSPAIITAAIARYILIICCSGNSPSAPRNEHKKNASSPDHARVLTPSFKI